MKKRFIINPALILFACLISISGDSQNLFASYLVKENYESKIEELRKEFSTNKLIPKEVELECLTALSYYPQLKNTHIVFRFGKTSSTMVSRPKLNSILKKNAKREYQVIIKKPGASNIGLEWTELSFNSMVGWIGHELGHITHYDHKGFAGIAIMGIKYAFPNYRRRMERFTDQLAIKHDLGSALYEGTEYMINSSNATQKYKRRLQKFYLSPVEIKKYTNLKYLFKINYQKMRIVDINAIVKNK
jgi:hypothetical protein